MVMVPQRRPFASTSAALLTDGDLRRLVHRERERQRPYGAVREAQAIEHRLVVGLAEEARERAGRAGRDQLEVGLLARVERQRGQRRGARGKGGGFGFRNEAVHEGAAVWRNKRAITTSCVSLWLEVVNRSVFRWRPHSFFWKPRQRPARGSSPSATGVVHGRQPMLG